MTALTNLSLLFRPVQAKLLRPFIITICASTIDNMAQRSVEGRP